MIDPSEVVNNLVTALRSIGDLVKEMGNDQTKIYAYHDSFPKNVSLTHALHSMPAPGIMVAWQGTGPGAFGGMDVWKHHVTIFLRATAEATVGTAYYTLFRLITKGVPYASKDTDPNYAAKIPMSNYAIHCSCDPMDIPHIQRQTDAEGLDYFEIPMSFTEIGDQ